MGYKCYFNKEGLIFSKTNAYINIFLDNIAFKKQHAEWTVTSDSVYCESLYFWHFCEMVFVEADFEGLRRTIIKACLKERMGIRSEGAVFTDRKQIAFTSSDNLVQKREWE